MVAMCLELERVAAPRKQLKSRWRSSDSEIARPARRRQMTKRSFDAEVSDAIEADDAVALKSLLKERPTLVKEGVSGSWLNSAAESGSLACARILLEAGAELETKTQYGAMTHCSKRCLPKKQRWHCGS
jgi:hypothetical protein